jgi:hypothetical protein
MDVKTEMKINKITRLTILVNNGKGDKTKAGLMKCGIRLLEGL